MNQFIENRFVENIQRLALGLVLIDSQRGARIAHPIKVMLDRSQLEILRPEIERHNSCLHALRFYRNSPELVDFSLVVPIRHSEKQHLRMPFLIQTNQVGGDRFVDIRFVDPTRRFVPRRIRIPMGIATDAELQPYTHRVRRTSLFPGAAYDVHSSATGIRGRVLRENRPMRWVRVEATQPGTNTLIGRAHGDDRGEFLLLVGAGQMPVGNLVNPLSVNVTVFGPTIAPIPSSPEIPGLDPLWDLPLEIAVPPGVLDTVSAGETLPGGYRAIQTGTRQVSIPLGRVNQGETEFIFT